jgi:hypothetical protein
MYSQWLVNTGSTEERVDHVKLPAHRAGLPGNEISFLIVPLDPDYKAALSGHLPARLEKTGPSMDGIPLKSNLSLDPLKRKLPKSNFFLDKYNYLKYTNIKK